MLPPSSSSGLAGSASSSSLVGSSSSSSPFSSSLTNKDFVSIVSGPHVHVLENGSLVIVEADKSDEGEYLCGSSNSIGTLVSNSVTVKVNTPAYFKKNFLLIKCRIGERILLPCEVFGDEPIKLTWSRDGEILSNSNYSPRAKHIIQESTGGMTSGSLVSSRISRLAIESVDLTDSAFYTCTASNTYGREELSVQLLVQGPPDPPVTLKTLEISARRLLIQWNNPADGNSPIIEYTVNYRKNDGNCSIAFFYFFFLLPSLFRLHRQAAITVSSFTAVHFYCFLFTVQMNPPLEPPQPPVKSNAARVFIVLSACALLVDFR